MIISTLFLSLKSFFPKSTPKRRSVLARRRHESGAESLEPRTLLTNNFLAGTAYIDANVDGQLGTTESYLSGATIELRTSDGLTVLDTVVTNATGSYFFNGDGQGLAPGNYKVVNLSAAGYAATSSQAMSKISSVTATSANSIDVTLVDPSDLQVSIDLGAFFSSGLGRNINYTLFGTNVAASGGQLPAKLHSSVFSPDPTAPFLTVCTDLFNDLDSGVNGPFDVDPDAVPIGGGGLGLPHNGERVAYLYNHYGQSAQGATAATKANNAAALQIAVWELLYDADASDPDGNLETGNFFVTASGGAAQTATVKGIANALLAESVGKSEAAVFLNIPVPPAPPTSPTVNRTQGTIVTGSFNFGNLPEARLGNFVWNDLNADGIQDSGEPGIEGAVVTLTGPSGPQSFTTLADGEYQFTNLIPGTYTVSVVAPGGFVATLTGEGTTATDSNGNPTSTTLLSGDSDQTLDFGYYLPAIAIKKYVSEVISTSGEGLTPGYWKQSQHFSSWVGYTQSQLYNTVFGVNDDPALTLLGALQRGGGGKDALGRHAVAAILNAANANISYLYSFSQIEAMVQTAFLTGEYESPKNSLATQNELGADLTPGGGTSANGPLNDANTAPGLIVQTGNQVSFSYYVTNAGSVALANVVVVDDNATPGNLADDFNPASILVGGFNVGDTDHDGQLDTNELWQYSAGPILVSDGQHTNIGSVTGTPVGGGGHVSATDPANWFGISDLDATIGNFVWLDTNADGIQNSGEPGVPGAVVTLYTSANLQVGASQTTGADGLYLFTGLTPGDYYVQVTPPSGYLFSPQDAGGNTVASDAVDSDANTSTGVMATTTLTSGEDDRTWDAGLYLIPDPGIDIEKSTNGSSNSNSTAPDFDNEDAANGAGVPILAPGDLVTWTYHVSNTGNTVFTTSDIVIVDDNGTPANTADDLSTTGGQITFVSVQTGDGDSLLEPGEVWSYKSTGAAQNLSGSSGSSVTLNFSGNSALDGTNGNVRPFSAGSVSVKTTAFSREKGTNGAWSNAYLGSYGGGLGVTDSSEGDGSSNMHTVDNVGRDNYVLFAFDQSIIIDSTFLGYVVDDSDIKVWIGTISGAYTSLPSLSDSVLASLGFTEVNLGYDGNSRLADINNGNYVGNVLVIAADTTDSTPDDRFKIEKVTVRPAVPGIYENKGTVNVPGATDSDLSHYKNPTAPTASISGTKYEDLTGNGLSVDDTPLGGTVIRLYKDTNLNGVRDSGDGAAVASTISAAGTGTYSFNVSVLGLYFVEEVVPTGFVRTAPTFFDYSPVTVATNVNYGGNNFANYEKCDLSHLTNVYYVINGSATVTDLRGNVNPGDTVKAYFTITAGAEAHRYSLVSYTAPSSVFIASEASQQQVFSTATGVFGPGSYSLTVVVPNSNFQVDFVCGTVLAPLGPEGSNIFYTPQGRLISADNGGTQTCDLSSLSGYVYVDANNNGVKNSGEIAIANVTVTLTGTDIYGIAVNRSTTTNSSGYYVFGNLQASNAAGYELTETQPATYLDGKDAIGSQGGTTGNDVLTTAFLNTNTTGINNNFGEQPLDYTKFYVVNSASTDRTYEYKPDGSLVESYTINSGNTQPRGIATTAADNKVWVVDANKKVYVYNTSGGLLGSWTAGSLPSSAIVEDITTNGTDVWIVDANSDKVYRYANAASKLSGTAYAASSFALNSGNANPKGLVTDGTSIWVVNDSSTDKVFKYSVTGTFRGSWTIASVNSAPTGITINPADVSDIWIVDSNDAKVYQYSDAATRTSGSQNAATSFALASGNSCAQGIADPPPRLNSLTDTVETVSAPTSITMARKAVNRIAEALTPWTRVRTNTGTESQQLSEVTRLAHASPAEMHASGNRNRRRIKSVSNDPSDSLMGQKFTRSDAGEFSPNAEVDALFADWNTDPLELLTSGK